MTGGSMHDCRFDVWSPKMRINQSPQLTDAQKNCCSISAGCILIAAAESMPDGRGIRWPTAIAPFSVVITSIKYDGEVTEAADDLYTQFNAAGIDALLDDRDARPGFKFADADLIGFPIRITVGDRGLKEGKLELKRRKAAEAEMVPVDAVIEKVREALR